jgi:ergothioneine biosynthesis protein EgtB
MDSTAKLALAPDREAFSARFTAARARSEALARKLSPEDQTLQSMPDASPTKWHLAHVTWFWETFLLAPRLAGYRPFDPDYDYLFNSYYESVGARHPRPARGMLSRPGVAEIGRYRDHVTAAMDRLIAGASAASWREILPLIELGIAHEEQHQELILMDIKHALAQNPLKPAYEAGSKAARRPAAPLDWREFKGGLTEIGHDGAGFAFDNEAPRHKVYLTPFRLASRCATNAEYLAFIEDGGYARPEFWLSDGWAAVNAQGWQAPLYWEREGAGWQTFTLNGMAPLDPAAPVCHVSHYEADAFAAWAGRRLPTEAEWEHAATDDGLSQMSDEVWQWTQSAYTPYPGFKPPHGALGEYNGKFMSGQMVLRGGSAATPPGHARPSYRNFFYPGSRWCFAGIRLAEDF